MISFEPLNHLPLIFLDILEQHLEIDFGALGLVDADPIFSLPPEPILVLEILMVLFLGMLRVEGIWVQKSVIFDQKWFLTLDAFNGVITILKT